MAVLKRIVCLANSRKRSGRCIAGKELMSLGYGSWIRPVSARPYEEVSEQERRYEDGGEPQLLDVIDVPLLHALPRSHQSENWLLDPHSRWVCAGRASADELCALADDPPGLWVNGHSTSSGLNDRVTVSDAEGLSNSLYLVRLDELKLRVFAPGAAFGNLRRRAQARFTSRQVPYWLWMTDPTMEQTYLAGPDGEFLLPECFATVSLGEPNDDGYCYKLVAAIIVPADNWMGPGR